MERELTAQTPPEVQRRDGLEPVTIPDHQLLRRIGRGSYGEVWLARSVTGAYRAVKIVHRSAFDHDRPFEREFSGILKFEPISRKHDSQLDILHVGRGEDSFFYVMELADDPLTGQEVNPDSYAPRTLKRELLHRGRLPFEECVQISLSLTTALENLHSQGLVHRDIKPSNVVFVNGVAKLADIGLVTSVDASRSFVGTEGFVPPEGPGTPQGDLYSLGKVLYEICTGKDRQEFPELPSDLDAWPEREGLLELNAVIAKACREDPRQRYGSAQAMHRDLLLLQSGKSLARLHAAERALAKVKRTAVVAGAVVLVLAVGLGLAAMGWRQARMERDEALRARAAEEAQRKAAQAAQKRAETEAAKSKQVAQFLKDMLGSVGGPETLGRDTSLLREILDRTAERVGKDLSHQPEVEVELRLTLAEFYHSLGIWDKEMDMASNALSVARSRLGEGNRLSALALKDLGSAEFDSGRMAPAEVLFRQAVQSLKKQHDESHDLVSALGELGVSLANEGKLGEAEAVFREGLGTQRRLYGGHDLDTYEYLLDLARMLSEQNEYSKAEPLCREAFALGRELEPSDDVKYFVESQGRRLLEEPTDALAQCLRRQRKGIELDHFYRELEPTSLDTPQQAADLLQARASALAWQGQWKRAAADLSRVVRLDPSDHLEYGSMAALLVAIGDENGYREMCRRSLERFGNSLAPGIADRVTKICCVEPSSGVDLNVVAQLSERSEPSNPWHQVSRGMIAYRQGHFAEAAEWTQKALKVEGFWQRRDIEACMVLAMAEYQQQHFEEARAALGRGIKAIAADWYDAADNEIGNDWEDWVFGQQLMKEAKALIAPAAQIPRRP